MEILLVIVVLAILATLSAPSFRSALQNNRLSGAANEVMTSFQFARAEALKRGTDVRVCSSSDGATCGGNWNQGWIVSCTVAADCPDVTNGVIRTWPGNGTDFNFNPTTGQYTFEENGFGNAAFQLDLSLPDCFGENLRQIQVVPTGRTAVTRADCPT